MKALTIGLFTNTLLFSFICYGQQTVSSYHQPYSVVESKNIKERNIYIKDNQTNQTQLFRKIDDAPMYGFRNFATYFPGNLYILVRKNEESQDWQDELWHYTPTEKNFIASARGLSFSVQPQQSFIAYTTGRNITIHDLQNSKTLKKIEVIKDPESIEEINLAKWSLTGNVLWGYTSELDGIGVFFSYNIDKDKLTTYSNAGGSLGLDINPDKGLLLYSDYPQFFDVESENAFLKKNPSVNLYLYNFQTKQRTKLLTQKKKDFSAQWLTPDTLEYYDATLKKRVQKKI